MAVDAGDEHVEPVTSPRRDRGLGAWFQRASEKVPREGVEASQTVLVEERSVHGDREQRRTGYDRGRRHGTSEGVPLCGPARSRPFPGAVIDLAITAENEDVQM